MDTPAQIQDRLKEILDRIGPGMSLRVDDRVLRGAFGNDAQGDEATEFARRNGCAFKYERPTHGDGMGEFGRAYYA